MMKRIKLKSFLLALSFLILPRIVFAGVGDVLTSCDFEGGTGSALSAVGACTNWGKVSDIDTVASIVTGGHDGGKAISYYYPNLGNEVVKTFWTPSLPQRQEITLDYWEKFDTDLPSSNIWNVKSVRPYVGATVSNSNNYMAGTMSRHNSSYWYQSRWGNASLDVTSAVNFVSTSSGYCTGSGFNFLCNSSQTSDGRMEVGFVNLWGTSWHNVRMYIKVPSNNTSADGETKVWIDGTLVYTLRNITPSSNWSADWLPYTSSITFHPSDDFFEPADKTNCDDQVHACGPHTNTIDPAKPYCPWTCDKKTDFHHLYDDIVVYDGYVPPAGGDIVAPASPSVLNVQ